MTATDLPEACERRALAAFLKQMRARRKPADLGLPSSPRRRAAGLLREEVALAAGMSATWYTWMEQGRAVNPSARVLDGIVRALRLDDAERDYLFRLARPDLRAPLRPSAGRPLSPPLDSLLAGLSPHPAYAFDACFDVVAWNRPAEVLLGAFDEAHPLRRNVLGRLFLDRAWRRLFENWEGIAASAVGQFRSMTAPLQDDARFLGFVRELQAASPEFAELWRQQAVRDLPACRKTLIHPAAGRLVFDYATLRPDGAAGDLRFTIYTPAAPETARAFADWLEAGEALASPAAAV